MNSIDYLLMFSQTSMTQEQILLQVENTEDMINIELINVYLADSPIQGKGLFSEKNIDSGRHICYSRIGDKRTIAGRYTNHALYPNAKMIVEKDKVKLVAIKDIEANEEITVNYREVLTERFNRGDLCQA